MLFLELSAKAFDQSLWLVGSYRDNEARSRLGETLERAIGSAVGRCAWLAN